MLTNNIGNKLRMLRFMKNLTQKEVADALNMKVATISRIENNIGEHRMSTIKKLVDFFGVTLEELIKS
ncbi:helix-turn-helix domain-containing protein [Mesobacillus foraminis]|uniref:helix-turn-helix domain-containing protein n=1 Tax=Mesobacillus foraminis TaxID=279826 RepID=UPI00214BCB68|nr:helix-turn-helix transcriptional regulator [Mesobacillus foraminis]